MQLIFVTGNREKFEIAEAVSRQYDLNLIQKSVPIDEIQGEESEPIVRHKARTAFNLIGEPLVVSDDFWRIPGLHGFPGPYMKSVAQWFSSEDFLRLTSHLTDRRIILDQSLCYDDGQVQRVFTMSHTGTLLTEARGTYGVSLQKVLSMPGDNGLSVAEAYDQGAEREDREVSVAWRQLFAWVQARSR
jgi:inosine/xanthosine triphosphate pyrophosphatase family protein